MELMQCIVLVCAFPSIYRKMFACLPVYRNNHPNRGHRAPNRIFSSGKSCVQAAKDALAESRRLVVDRCNCTRLQRRASRWRFRCCRNLSVQTLHYFSDSGNSNDMKYVYNFVILYKWETNMKFHEIPTAEADYMLPNCLFQSWNLLGLLVNFMSSTSSHLRSGWSLQTIMKLEQPPGKTETNSFVFRPTACSSYLSDNCSDENLRFACGWIFQRRAVLKQMEGVRLCWSIFLRTQEICGERVLQRFGHTTLPPEDKSLEAGKEMWRRKQRHISHIFTSFCLYLFCRLSAALLSALRHPWRQKTCDGQSQRDSKTCVL